MLIFVNTSCIIAKCYLCSLYIIVECICRFQFMTVYLNYRYEITPEGKRATRLDQILLNGNNIAILVPGGDPESGGSASIAAAAEPRSDDE